MASYTLGDLVRCEGEFRDPRNGVLVDPSTVTFRVRAPSGGVTSSTPTREGTGLYTADVNLDEPGTWHYRFESGGSFQAAEEGRFTADAGEFG